MNEIDENIIGDVLSPKQERFCVLYTQNYELFGNATLSYAEAYGYDLESMDRDDAIYKLNTGEEVDQKTYDDLPSEKTKRAECIKESTYKRYYDLCSSYGSRLRRNDKIQTRCRELLNAFMIDNVIDARLTEIILKGKDQDSINAIKEYNKLKQRITERVDHTSKGESIVGFNFIRNDNTNNSDNKTNP